jgi:hypothetical protein
LGDGTYLPFEEGEFDVVIGTDFLEHLPEKDVPFAILEAEYATKKYVIWFTPIGFMDTEKYQPELITSEYDRHLSGFEPEYFTSKRYKIDILPDFHSYGSKVWGAMWCWYDI